MSVGPPPPLTKPSHTDRANALDAAVRFTSHFIDPGNVSDEMALLHVEYTMKVTRVFSWYLFNGIVPTRDEIATALRG